MFIYIFPHQTCAPRSSAVQFIDMRHVNWSPKKVLLTTFHLFNDVGWDDLAMASLIFGCACLRLDRPGRIFSITTQTQTRFLKLRRNGRLGNRRRENSYHILHQLFVRAISCQLFISRAFADIKLCWSSNLLLAGLMWPDVVGSRSAIHLR